MVDATQSLTIQSVTKRFSGLVALDGVSVEVGPSEIVGLIGPNGSGKTTLFNVVTGVFPPNSGKVTFRGRDITGKAPEVVASSGIGRTFQIPRLFAGLTVAENVLIGAHLRSNVGFLRSMFRIPPTYQEERQCGELAMSILEFVGLTELAQVEARKLPTGRVRLLELARALATNPSLIMLDETASGLNSEEALVLAGKLREVHARGVALLVIEHNMQFVMDLCQRIVVLSGGKKLAEGTPDEIHANDDVVEAYLGRA